LVRTRWCVPVGSLVRTPGTRVSSSPCTARGDWALHPEDLSQTTVHPTESQSRPLACLSCFLSWVGIRRPNLINELSGWPAPDSPLRTQEPVLDRRTGALPGLWQTQSDPQLVGTTDHDVGVLVCILGLTNPHN